MLARYQHLIIYDCTLPLVVEIFLIFLKNLPFSHEGQNKYRLLKKEKKKKKYLNRLNRFLWIIEHNAAAEIIFSNYYQRITCITKKRRKIHFVIFEIFLFIFPVCNLILIVREKCELLKMRNFVNHIRILLNHTTFCILIKFWSKSDA